MAAEPTLHLTNWSSRRLHGPGRRLSIMAAPRPFELREEEGVVGVLVPRGDEVRLLQQLIDARRSGAAPEGEPLERYRWLLERRWTTAEAEGDLRPGALGLVGRAHLPAHQAGRIFRGVQRVMSGDTLLCACARSEAQDGRCHRTWAAAFLVRSGWRVILDGEEVRDVSP